MVNRSRFGMVREAGGFRLRQLAGQVRLRLADPAQTTSAIDRLRAEGGTGEEGMAPVFVLGGGWRTGSTVVQRMLNDGGDLLVWGEPYGEGAIVQRLAESLSFLDPACGRSESMLLPDGADLPAVSEWTANMTPPMHHLVAAQRAYLDRLFAAPAHRHGYERWGVKEVVWGRAEIDLLAMLYPDARFVLLVRDPLTQWASYRPVTRKPWFQRWPERPVGSPLSFGELWRDLVTDFIAADRELPQATLVRHENLHDPDELSRLTEFLDLRKPLNADAPRVGSSGSIRYFTTTVPAWEKAVIRRLTAKAAGEVGYA